MFLEERDQEVHGQVDVLDQHLVSHANIADGNTEAQNLKKIEDYLQYTYKKLTKSCIILGIGIIQV